MSYFGGYSEFICVLVVWVVFLLDGLLLKEVMIFGIVGFIVVFLVDVFEFSGVIFDVGKIVVSGVIGGVGSLSLVIFFKWGFFVVVFFGKSDVKEFLEKFGVFEIVLREVF